MTCSCPHPNRWRCAELRRELPPTVSPGLSPLGAEMVAGLTAFCDFLDDQPCSCPCHDAAAADSEPSRLVDVLDRLAGLHTFPRPELDPGKGIPDAPTSR